ncbi:uncharacterized protein LOC128882796 [Hylaeus volcanicus]|uniref:uncharacterized protein LOC128882796 n=1 Tax=Hylaeus volcanicus TaxID=313075 RepID=UPI0023B86650|nr:uncharacterized protein LOC128882796 [Hylaeus volcanicus]
MKQYHGIAIDNKLTFNEHYQEIMGKVRKRLVIINYLCHGEKGIKQNQAAHDGKSISNIGDGIRSSRVYERKETTRAPRRLESKAIRTAMGYRISTPLSVMYSEAGWIGYKDRVKACKYWMSQMEKGMSQNPTLKIFEEIQMRNGFSQDGFRKENVNITNNISEEALKKNVQIQGLDIQKRFNEGENRTLKMVF